MAYLAKTVILHTTEGKIEFGGYQIGGTKLLTIQTEGGLFFKLDPTEVEDFAKELLEYNKYLQEE